MSTTGPRTPSAAATAWRSFGLTRHSMWRRPMTPTQVHPRRGRCILAPCTPRCARRGRVRVPSAVWPSNRCRWPFFTRGWASLVNRSLNMFTLIAIGTGTAYVYSVIATLVPGLFPDSFRTHSGEVAVYFEAAAVITTLVLLGQVLELRAQPDEQ